jgi:hypothetical protein
LQKEISVLKVQGWAERERSSRKIRTYKQHMPQGMDTMVTETTKL